MWKKENVELRETVLKHDIPIWKLSEKIGINPSTMSCWLRFPLEGERKARVDAALAALIEEKSK